MRSILKRILPYLAYFYRYLRYRLAVILFISILVGLMDGLGLAMFIPVLEMAVDKEAISADHNLGNLAFLVRALDYFGLELTLTLALTVMWFFFIVKGVAKWLVTYLSVIYQQYFTRTIRIENVKALADFEYQYFVEADAGRIQNTLGGEANRVVGAYRRYSQMLQQIVLVITYSALALLANPQFALIVMVGGVLSNLLFTVLFRKTKKLSKKVVRSNHGYQKLLIQNVAFFKYLKATGTARHYAKYLIEKVHEIEHSVRQIGIINSIMTGLREPILIGIVILTIFVQIQVMGGSMATILLSLLFFYRGLGAVMLLQTSYNQFLAYTGSISNMTEFVGELKSRSTNKKGEKYTGIQDVLKIAEVSFAYQGGEEVLSEVDLEIRKNETVALVGESGSGKTTLMNLLGGLLQPTQGKISIDGTDMQKLNIASFQRRIGYITQEPVVFDDTIFDNVTFWAEKTPENLAAFWQALEKADILEFVKAHPEQEEARLGNNGINLSGGQKQRISIARELYKNNIEFLFMDEATSALDSETERNIQLNIDRLKGDYTTIIIAHRLSTIKNADRVIMLKNGRIDQIGPYEELIKESEAFKRMVELQEL